jgi:hypothetical protein
MLVLSLLCLQVSAAPAVVCVPMAASAALYAWLCIRRIQSAEAFVLALAADGCLYMVGTGGRRRVEAARWQDFGYLAVLRCRHAGRSAVYFWWRRLLPADQRRALWRMMNASATAKLENPPSLIVNPLL